MNGKAISRTALVASLAAVLLAPADASAVPLFARRHDLSCAACHSVAPKLNANGLAFQASGYRLPERAGASRASEPTAPLAVWITGRYEDRADGASDLFLPKVELIAGAPLGRSGSYFAEWRIVSLSLAADGSLSDRGGRFEDLFVEWGLGPKGALKIGQYRSLNQDDVSLRLSPSEPALYSSGLPTGRHGDPRSASLDRFSPSSRSPSLGYSLRSLGGERAGDGLFHFVTIPFVGELSIPLSDEADERASFELRGPPKGVFLETFYRRGLRSVGAHAFVAEEGWLATVLATWDWRSLVVTAGAGYEDRDDGGARRRASLQSELLWTAADRARGAAGLRLEETSGDGRNVTVIPYLAATLPNRRHTFLIQLEYKEVDGRSAFVADLSALF